MKIRLSFFLLILISLISTVGIAFFYIPIRNIPIPYLIIEFFIVFAIHLIYYKKCFKGLVSSPNKQEKVITYTSSLFAILFLISSRGPQNFLKDNSLFIILLTYLGSFLLIFVCISLFSMALIKRTNIQSTKKAGLKDFVTFFLIIFLTGIVYWMAFYPAGMSTDSLNSWNQVHTKQFNDWHPIIFTWTIMLLTYIWDSPAIVSLFQIAVLSLIFATTFVQLQRLGVKKYHLVIMSLIMAIIPSFTVFSIIIWKDILFSVSILLFTVHLFLINYSKGLWLKHKGNYLLFFLSSFGVVFYRHNGFPVFVFTMIVLILIYWKSLLKVTCSILIILVIAHQILTGPIFKYLGVESSDPNEALSIPTQQIANVIKNDGNLTEEQLNYYNSIFPIKMWKEKYNPYTVDPIKFSWGNYHREVIFDDFPKYLKTWGKVVVQNPLLVVDAYIKQSSLVWQMRIPEGGYEYIYNIGVNKNNFGIESSPISSSLNKWVTKYLEESKLNPYIKVVWRPALYSFIILICSVVILLKNGWRSGVVVLPFLLNLLSIAAALPAQDFRYLLPSVFVSFVFPFMAYINPNLKEEKSNG
ncbi:DUF6020 family protein [Neobacillus sp. M.A.Huq-85]